MHEEARNYCSTYSDLVSGHALDLGGRYVNGSVHEYWPNMQWTCVDKLPLGDVFESGYYFQFNAATWVPDREYDLVICTEVFEHTPEWRDICKTAFKALKSDHNFLVTCAGPERPRHSAIDGAEIRKGEYYWNIQPHLLGMHLKSIGFQHVLIAYDPHAGDVYASAYKP